MNRAQLPGVRVVGEVRPVIQTLGDVLGPLSYMGQCPCGAQHMSRNARVLVRGADVLCEKCAKVALEREVRP